MPLSEIFSTLSNLTLFAELSQCGTESTHSSIREYIHILEWTRTEWKLQINGKKKEVRPQNGGRGGSGVYFSSFHLFLCAENVTKNKKKTHRIWNKIKSKSLGDPLSRSYYNKISIHFFRAVGLLVGCFRIWNFLSLLVYTAKRRGCHPFYGNYEYYS